MQERHRVEIELASLVEANSRLSPAAAAPELVSEPRRPLADPQRSPWRQSRATDAPE
jgi:hypothetical protein